ncbi:MAG: hypothetical protein JNJ61_04965 [Anaerolineae bacterium]|nr:hypothetical protein [Anaerolineae bacterium]
MNLSRRMVWIGVGTLAAGVVLIILTLALTPQATNPAFAAATTFWNAAGAGDDATALALLDETMQAWVADNCPQGSVSACVRAYTPAEWGNLLEAVFRRAAPDGPRAWNVDVIATYEFERGFSGVCGYFRVEQGADEQWRIAGWAGYLWCGDPASRNMATNPDSPNRAP